MVAAVAVMSPTAFGRFLERVMDERKIKPGQLAAFAGVSPNTVNLWLRGVSEPKISSLRSLARRLGLDAQALVEAVVDRNDAAFASLDTGYDASIDEIEDLFRQAFGKLQRLKGAAGPHSGLEE